MASIKESVSILQVYNKYLGTNFSLSQVKRANVKCPFHKDEKASARIYLDTNTLYCFSCLKHWSPVKFIQEHTGLTPEEAKREACEIGGIEYRPAAPMTEDEQIYYDVYKYVAGLFNFIDDGGYFKSRGFSNEVIRDYQLGYCPVVFDVKYSTTPVTLREVLIQAFPKVPVEILDGLGLYDFKGVSRFADRYIFPIFDKYGRVVGFTGRAKEGVEPKYYNTSSEAKYFNKRQLLYNLDTALNFPTVYVVEGPADALSLITSGIKNVVAPLGTAFTEEHLELLKGKEIILSLDNDRAGLNTMYKLIVAKPTVRFNVLLLNGYKDFNEALIKGADLKEIVKVSKAMSAIDFIIYSYKNVCDLSILSNRVMMARQIDYQLKAGNYHWVEVHYYTTILERMFKRG